MLGIPVNYTTLPTLIYQRLSGFGPRVLSDMAVLSLLIGALSGRGLIRVALNGDKASKADQWVLNMRIREKRQR